ncbi:TPA: hypothetical protein ACH3X3_004064 [Trebouxia sp. C0006]
MPRGGVGCKDISPKEVEDAFKLTAPGFVLTPEAASNQDIIYQGSKGGAQGTLDKYNTYIPEWLRYMQEQKLTRPDFTALVTDKWKVQRFL